MSQTEWIDLQRKARGLREVQLHKMPVWFRKRIVARLGSPWECEWLNSREPWSVLIDHWGCSVSTPEQNRPWWHGDGQSVLVVEPYRPYKSDTFGIAGLMAEFFGVHFRVLPKSESWWFPDNTVRIEFEECRHEGACCKTCSIHELKLRRRGIPNAS